MNTVHAIGTVCPVEYLNLHWIHGEKWFHKTLVDADVAINAYMWQNGGHSGMDQWNFVMHPVFAAKTCDPEGDYVRRWVPELAGLRSGVLASETVPSLAPNAPHLVDLRGRIVAWSGLWPTAARPSCPPHSPRAQSLQPHCWGEPGAAWGRL